MEKKLNKRISRIGKIIIAEVWTHSSSFEIVMDKKEFSRGGGKPFIMAMFYNGYSYV